MMPSDIEQAARPRLSVDQQWLMLNRFFERPDLKRFVLEQKPYLPGYWVAHITMQDEFHAVSSAPTAGEAIRDALLILDKAICKGATCQTS